MNSTLNNKDFFKDMKKYSLELSKEDDFTKAFPFFCMKIFFPNLSDNDIEDATYGLGSNDESIDAFWVDDEKEEINICQFKSVISEKKAEIDLAKKQWFSFLKDVPKKLLDNNFIKKHKNQRIREDISFAFEAAYKADYSVNLYLFHLGYSAENNIIDYSNVNYFGFDDIKNKWLEFQSMTSLTDPAECEVNINYSNESQNRILEYKARYNNAAKKTFVTILTGYELVLLRNKYRYQLFDRNIRYYLGETNKVNREIIKSAEKNPDIFYCFNNGITITCSKCRETIKNEKLKLNNPQIINGAQTVNSLYAAYNKMLKRKMADFGKQNKEDAVNYIEEHFKRIKVLCRIVESTKGENTEFARMLTQYTNSQNDVKIFDFYANDPIQEALQVKFSEYGYFYERKRGERAYITKEPHEILGKVAKDFPNWDVKINIQNLASIYQAYLGKPSYAEVNAKTILESNTREDYRNIFGSRLSDVNKEKIENMILAINIYNNVEKNAKLYDKIIKIWGELGEDPNSVVLLNRLKENISKLGFIGTQLEKEICKYDNYVELQPIFTKNFISKYFLISRGKNMLTALIKYIIDENQYNNQIFENGIFKESEAINNMIVKRWIKFLIKDAILPIYEQVREKEKLSEETFYKRIGYFSKIADRIKEIQLNDDRDLKELFPLDFNYKNSYN